MCQSLPEAIFSVVAMVWTCFSTTFLSLLGLTLLEGGSPCSTYVLLVFPFSAGLDLQSISCPTPCHLKLPPFAASVPSFDACSQRWLWRYHTRSVQCCAAAVLASCSLANPACFRKALRTLFVHTELTVGSPLRTSNVIRSVRSSHLFSSSESALPSSARVSARSLFGPVRVALAGKLSLAGCQRLVLQLTLLFLLVPPIS